MIDVTIERNRYVGGSDIPVIFNGSYFQKNIKELALEKAGIIENEFEGNEYTEFGQAFEPKIRNYINESFGYNFEEETFIDNFYRGNLDGYDKKNNLVLEIKTSSNPEKNQKIYNLQIQFYLMLSGASEALLATYEREDLNEEFSPEKIKIITIKKDDNLIKKIIEKVQKFWTTVETLKIEPFLSDTEISTHLLGDGDSGEIMNEFISKIDILNNKLETMKQVEKELKEEKEKLYTFFNENDIKSFESNKFKISKVEETITTTFDTKKFKEENEELYNSFLKETKRKGYVKVTKKGE